MGQRARMSIGDRVCAMGVRAMGVRAMGVRAMGVRAMGVRAMGVCAMGSRAAWKTLCMHALSARVAVSSCSNRVCASACWRCWGKQLPAAVGHWGKQLPAAVGHWGVL